jgi:hypothetical protein
MGVVQGTISITGDELMKQLGFRPEQPDPRDAEAPPGTPLHDIMLHNIQFWRGVADDPDFWDADIATILKQDMNAFEEFLLRPIQPQALLDALDCISWQDVSMSHHFVAAAPELLGEYDSYGAMKLAWAEAVIKFATAADTRKPGDACVTGK